MAFLDKFKNKTQPENPPPGVNLEYSSFGVQKKENTYKPSDVPQPTQQSKPSNPASRHKGRPGGGWEDDEEDEQPKITPPKQDNLMSPFTQSQTPVPVQEPLKKSYESIQMSRLQNFQAFQVLSMEEIEAGNYEYEQSIVNEVTKLGGVRLKQSDTVQKEFGQAAENLQEQIIGSVLIHRLHNEDNYKVQARVAYAIEYLIQAFQKYKKYFEKNIQYLNIDTNQQQLQQVLTQLRGDITGQPVKQAQDIQFEFIEPPKPPSPLKQPIQQQPQATDLFEIDTNNTTQPQKKNAFGFLKSKTQNVVVSDNSLQQHPYQQPLDTNLLDQPSSAGLLQSEQQPKKANAFGFLKKNQSQQQQPQQSTSLPQYFEQPSLLDTSPPLQQAQQQPQPPQNKPNAFQFLKKEQPQQPQQPQPQQLQQPQNLLTVGVNLTSSPPQQHNQSPPIANVTQPQQYPTYLPQGQYPPPQGQYPPPQYPYQPQYYPPHPYPQQQYPMQSSYPPQQPPYSQPQQPYYPPPQNVQHIQPQAAFYQPYPPQFTPQQYPPMYNQQYPQMGTQPPPNRSSEEVKLQQPEKKTNKNESAFDFIQI